MKQIMIIGHLGQDAVSKEINGSSFVEFSVAVNESYSKTDGTQVETTQWFNCTTRRLKLANYLKKGDQVMVQGNLSVKVYQDRQQAYKAGLEVHATNIQLLTPRSQQEERQQAQQLSSVIQQLQAFTSQLQSH